MEPKEIIESCITKCQTSAADMRKAANQTTNTQAKDTLMQSAKMIDDCVNQCKSTLNML